MSLQAMNVQSLSLSKVQETKVKTSLIATNTSPQTQLYIHYVFTHTVPPPSIRQPFK